MTNTKQTIMDIAMNLNRIGNWVADDYTSNKKKIDVFLLNTDSYMENLIISDDKFKPTWLNFMSAYPIIRKTPQDNAENLMTWGNILTHRASLIE